MADQASQLPPKIQFIVVALQGIFYLLTSVAVGSWIVFTYFYDDYRRTRQDSISRYIEARRPYFDRQFDVYAETVQVMAQILTSPQACNKAGSKPGWPVCTGDCSGPSLLKKSCNERPILMRRLNEIRFAELPFFSNDDEASSILEKFYKSIEPDTETKPHSQSVLDSLRPEVAKMSKALRQGMLRSLKESPN